MTSDRRVVVTAVEPMEPRKDPFIPIPYLPGHEATGVVEELGKGVHDVALIEPLVTPVQAGRIAGPLPAKHEAARRPGAEGFITGQCPLGQAGQAFQASPRGDHIKALIHP